MLNIIVRGFFLLYWFFDNLNILSKIKILGQDPKKMAKIGATCWLLALLTNLILLARNLLANCNQTKELKRYLSIYAGPSCQPAPREKFARRRRITNPARPSGQPSTSTLSRCWETSSQPDRAQKSSPICSDSQPMIRHADWED